MTWAPIMTDDQIVKAITRQLAIAMVLKLVGRNAVALKFVEHSIRSIAAHRAVCERWMAARAN